MEYDKKAAKYGDFFHFTGLNEMAIASTIDVERIECLKKEKSIWSFGMFCRRSEFANDYRKLNIDVVSLINFENSLRTSYGESLLTKASFALLVVLLAISKASEDLSEESWLHFDEMSKRRGYGVLEREVLSKGVRNIIACEAYRADLREIAKGCRVSLDEQSILKEAIDYKGVAWPLSPGCFLLELGNGMLLFDWAQSLGCLNSEISFPEKGGDIANFRGKWFEEYVQRKILESSAWGDLSGLPKSGKTLKLNGNAITDVDAFGQRENKVLMVSCKNLLYSKKEDAGEFGKVKSRHEQAKKAIYEWDERIRFFRENPKGDNYDFSGKMIYGVVCAPRVIFIDDISFYEQTGDLSLPKIVSIRELREWLEK